MRPVKKWWEGEQKTYDPHDKAKDDLIRNLGLYCSYCERHVGHASALHVEYVQPVKYTENGRKPYAHLETSWDNFLLACVNCNSTKSVKDVQIETHALPHRDNTYACFEYNGGGFGVRESLSDRISDCAQNTMTLLGLDRRPGMPDWSRKDTRWRDRVLVYFKAKHYRQRYLEGLSNIDDLMGVVSLSGFWMVFEEESEVRDRLIHSFNGTNEDYF